MVLYIRRPTAPTVRASSRLRQDYPHLGCRHRRTDREAVLRGRRHGHRLRSYRRASSRDVKAIRGDLVAGDTTSLGYRCRFYVQWRWLESVVRGRVAHVTRYDFGKVPRSVGVDADLQAVAPATDDRFVDGRNFRHGSAAVVHGGIPSRAARCSAIRTQDQDRGASSPPPYRRSMPCRC